MLAPRSVLVTGSNRGIGLEFVKQFLKLANPPDVIFGGCRNPDAAHDLNEVARSNPSVHVLKLDVTDQSTIDQAVASVTRLTSDRGLNLLVNNAAQIDLVNLPDVTREMMLRDFQVNTVGPLFVVKSFLPLLMEAARQQGREPLSCSRAAIINMSSDSGSISDNYLGTYHGGLYPYKASKAALNMVTNCLSIDLKSDGILCSAIHPGWVQTDGGGPDAEITTEECLKLCFKAMEKFQGEKWSGILYDCVNEKVMGW